MSQKTIERKTFFGNTLEIEKRESADILPKIKGYSALFDSATVIPSWWGDGWEEVIRFGFFDRAIKEKQDVRALFNHDQNYVLGRTSSPKKTLELKQDKTGLLATILPPNNSVGNDTVESIERGDITGQSFAFTIAEEKWTRRKGERDLRELIAVDTLYDVGPVTYPAFPDTDISVSRSAMKAQAEIRARGLKQFGESLPRDVIKELKEGSVFQVPRSFNLEDEDIAELRTIIREEVVAALEAAKGEAELEAEKTATSEDPPVEKTEPETEDKPTDEAPTEPEKEAPAVEAAPETPSEEQKSVARAKIQREKERFRLLEASL